MEKSLLNRRNFLAFIPAISIASTALVKSNHFPVACNGYNWITFYKRAGKKWGEDLEENMAELAKTGIKGYEPSIESKEMAQQLIPVLNKYNIALPSIYVNSILHDETLVKESISSIMGIAEVVKQYGTKIIVTNPSPIKWGSTQLKSDAQLALQAQAMETLGYQLRQMGLTLAYHTHDIELKAGAREFHHILLNTTPQNVSFCFDVHWVYRGSENSEAAVFDVLKLYGKRIVELHLRQSVAGIWAETFTAKGDIDYTRLAKELSKMNIKPHIVIEQCLETNSPNTMDVVNAHIKDLAAIKETFLS
ncbi:MULTISPECIES: sugar phosphate isomerase/epimerase [unclassified Arcicella]|uniref:sugar phosphate isomerase/epimerase family protein n=1 Tax=unclassified Arcicella TaxID=2644986 RepID=UPI002856014A|nr:MULTISPECIES: sugar phosphate isomerase/epimerase [unclassified Arcicella]MDR6562295.1 inosose dehydratase [Arcicella sp. BE51]MDR6812010.1 inosose dehydratase [Arcicella sp. BE140]MDR6823321.1 inosose dehydratase [Arcicella sp. BE139]